MLGMLVALSAILNPNISDAKDFHRGLAMCGMRTATDGSEMAPAKTEMDPLPHDSLIEEPSTAVVNQSFWQDSRRHSVLLVTWKTVGIELEKLKIRPSTFFCATLQEWRPLLYVALEGLTSFILSTSVRNQARLLYMPFTAILFLTTWDPSRNHFKTLHRSASSFILQERSTFNRGILTEPFKFARWLLWRRVSRERWAARKRKR